MTTYFVRTMSSNPHRPNTGAFAGKPHIEFLALPTHDPKAQKLVEDGFSGRHARTISGRSCGPCRVLKPTSKFQPPNIKPIKTGAVHNGNVC